MIFKVIFLMTVIAAVTCFPQPVKREITNNEIDTSVEDSSYVNFLFKCRDLAIRVRKFMETIERVLPKEITEEVNGNSKVTARINLFIGVRQFVMGIKQIANTLENVLSGGQSGNESKQLSQAPLVPTELFHTLVDAIQSLISAVRSTIVNYNYFIPEVGATACMYQYMREQYPTLHIYEYPGRALEDVYYGIENMFVEAKEQPVGEKIENAYVFNDNDRQEDVPNSTVDTYYNEADNEIFGARSLQSPRYLGSNAAMVKNSAAKWQTCSKIYALEAATRYFIVNYIL